MLLVRARSITPGTTMATSEDVTRFENHGGSQFRGVATCPWCQLAPEMRRRSEMYRSARGRRSQHAVSVLEDFERVLGFGTCVRGEGYDVPSK